MAGVSDQAFRTICANMGAGLVVNEMVTSDRRLWQSRKSQTRLCWSATESLRVIQIAGSEPQQMAEAATNCEQLGAQIIDLNMGCPAKKVCNKAAGSALLQDEKQVENILKAVVEAVAIPVTLKFRTGWSPENRNAVTVAKIAEQSGIAALTLHGRTRACRFNGHAEYDTIAKVVDAVSLPVIANGDINSAAKAKQVLKQTGAAAVMVGRAAQGNPWIFAQINAHLDNEPLPKLPSLADIQAVMLEHMRGLYDLYGEQMGARIARKHVAMYLAQQVRTEHRACADAWRRSFQNLTQQEEQFNAVCQLFERLHQLEDQAA